MELLDYGTHLPEEILLYIFCFAFPISALKLETSSPLFPRSAVFPIFEAELGFIYACRAWYRVGIELVYKHATLWSIGQLLSLVRTLESHVELGALVRRLDICYTIPEGGPEGYYRLDVAQGYYHLHTTQLEKLLNLCPRLAHFDFHPPSLFRGSAYCPPIIHNSLTSLDIGELTSYTDFLPSLVELCSTLQSLSFILPGIYDPTHPRLVFAKLTTLHLTMDANSLVSSTFYSFPNLQHLNLLSSRLRSSRLVYPARETQAHKFLDAYGDTITNLKISYLVADPLQELLDRCPALEHLAAAAAGPILPLRHPRLRGMNIFYLGGRTELGGWVLDLKELRIGLPALRAIRYVNEGVINFERVASSPTLRVAKPEGSRSAENIEEVFN